MPRTKIVATIGPATADLEAVRELVACGMSVARLNGSHANLDWHREAIAMIRKAAPEIPILLDIPGRKIRTAQLASEPSFSIGDIVVLTTDSSHDGSEKVPVSAENLHYELNPGDVVFADDGTLRFVVVEIDGRDIRCRAETAGTLRSRKGINVPAVTLAGDLVTERDRHFVSFAHAQGIDFVGISFVESASHVEAVRQLSSDEWPRVISKIENRRSLENMAEIIATSDGIMIDRGDLSVETSLETVALYQKEIIRVARDAGRPVIVATEMLHSMIDSPLPTKAEISDITNAVMDGCAATMLSGETAIGKFPKDAITVMRRISQETESYLDVGAGGQAAPGNHEATVPRAMELAIADICRSLPISKIIAVTRSGFAARVLAMHLPTQPILAVSDDPIAARAFNLLPGTEGVFLDIPFERYGTEHFLACLKALWHRGKVSDDDLVLVTGVVYPKSGNRMNLLQTHYVSDLIDVLDWRQEDTDGDDLAKPVRLAALWS